MPAEKAIFSILTADGALAALVDDRVFPLQRRQGTALPAVVYQQISGPRAHDLTGPIGWVESRYQITCWAATYTGAGDVADAVREAIDGNSGTTASVDIDHIFVVDEGDMPSLAAGNQQLEMYGKRLDIEVVFRE
ncbi:MAG TPA: DUF3168 domain-containing protein [Phycisphaerae bacterium]|nr:DUF3168 domain-containing protein [Phycisphaerae bacterium]